MQTLPTVPIIFEPQLLQIRFRTFTERFRLPWFYLMPNLRILILKGDTTAWAAIVCAILCGEVSAAPAVDLSVQIGALRLRNPILAASGTFGYGLEFAHLVNLNRLGGFVTKGLSREPMEGAPGPRLLVTPSGLLNAVGLQNVGVRAFVAEKLPVLRKFDTAVIANVFGCTLEDYVEVIRILEDAEGLGGYELNISCPNVKKGGLQFGSDPSL